MSWTVRHMNWKFHDSLIHVYPEGFTTKEAEELYLSTRASLTSDQTWARMTARNHIAAGAFYKLYTRTSRGRYIHVTGDEYYAAIEHIQECK